MNIKGVEKLADSYKKQLEVLDLETLKLIADDHSMALQSAKNGIEEVEPEQLTPEYIEQVADELQLTAKMILNEKSQN